MVYVSWLEKWICICDLTVDDVKEATWFHGFEKRGYCVPSQCQNGNCPIVGDKCKSGSLSGTCNSRKTCDYNELLSIAMCGKDFLSKRFLSCLIWQYWLSIFYVGI